MKFRMKISKIYIGSDHAGFTLKSILIEYLENLNIPVEDLGTYSDEMVDYPDYGKKVAEAVGKIRQVLVY